MYTDVVTRPADLSGRHSVLKQWDLLGPLNVAPCDPLRDAVEMPDDAAAAARVGEMLRHAGVGDDDPVIVLHVSAGNPFRRWPLDAFAALVVQLAANDPNRRFVVTSGPSERDASRQLANRIRAVSPARVIEGDVDVTELRALAARAAVYIGGDSGPMHVAATTSTPIVGLFGPTLAERSMPWRNPAFFSEAVDAGPLPCRPCRQRTCAPGDFRCLTTIAPERVVAAAERALASRRHHTPRVAHA